MDLKRLCAWFLVAAAAVGPVRAEDRLPFDAVATPGITLPVAHAAGPDADARRAQVALTSAAAPPPVFSYTARTNLPAANQPKLVLQVGHARGVDSAVWLNSGKFLITADGPDNSIILWDVKSGLATDFLRLPQLDPRGDHIPIQIEAMRADGDRRVAIVALVSGYSDSGGNPAGLRRVSFDLDLETRVVTRAGDPALPRRGLDPDNLVPPPLPAGVAGETLRREGRGLVVRFPEGREQRLGQAERQFYTDAAFSPDGTRLARLVHLYGGLTTMVEVSDLVAGQPLPTLIRKGYWDTVKWLSNAQYLVTAPVEPKTGLPPLPSLLVDADSAGGPKGLVRAEIPGRCLTTPYTDAFLLFAATAGNCGGPITAHEGVLMYMPDAPEVGWQFIANTASAGALVTAMAVSPGNDRLAVAVAPLKPDAQGAYVPRTLIFDISKLWIAGTHRIDTMMELRPQPRLAAELRGRDEPDTEIERLAWSADGSKLLQHLPYSLLVTDVATGKASFAETGLRDPDVLLSDGKTALVGGIQFPVVRRFSLGDGGVAPLDPALTILGAISGGFLPVKQLFWIASRDGAVRFWDMRSGERQMTLFAFPNNQFFVTAADGRYDTNMGPDTEAVRWLMPDAPWVSLPASAFMSNNYEPGLVAKLYACNAGGCDTALPPLPPVGSLTRLFPSIAIAGVAPGPSDGLARVTLDVREGASAVAEGPSQSSGIYDLRLMVNDRLVSQLPDPGAAILTRERDDWRRISVQQPARDVIDAGAIEPAPIRRDVIVAVPTTGAGSVSLSAYAFNQDRVKGETARLEWTLPTGWRPREKRLVVLAIGVDATRVKDWTLSYAAADARAMVDAFGSAPIGDGYAAPPKSSRWEDSGRGLIRPKLLATSITSTADRDQATKAAIRAALLSLSGAASDADRATLAAVGVDATRLPALTPDDALVISWSGHGDTIEKQFFLVPSDGGRLPDGHPDPASLISSAELTAWLRGVQAGDVSIVIDACHSAASVDADGYKPGPMGDPGLGQLAWDKGFRILAATQADNVAMEDGDLGHGLLTYALVSEGLTPLPPQQRADLVAQQGFAPAVRADLNADGQATLDEWLRFAVQRLPGLSKDIAAGLISLKSEASLASARQIINLDTPVAAAPRKVQRPSLFDFTGRSSEVVIR